MISCDLLVTLVKFKCFRPLGSNAVHAHIADDHQTIDLTGIQAQY